MAKTPMVSQRWLLRAGIIVASVLLVAWLRFTVRDANRAAGLVKSQSQLKQIGVALQNYYRAYESYPPAYTVGPTGERMHSWRALLLPYIWSPLAEQYRFDEPWNSPHNQQFAAQIPWVFRSPRWGESDQGLTTYLVPVGPNYMFNESECRYVKRDTMHRGILIYEHGNSSLNWLSPYDDQFDPLRTIMSDLANGEVVTASHADGSVRILGPRMTDAEVRDLLDVGPESVTEPESGRP